MNNIYKITNLRCSRWEELFDLARNAAKETERKMGSCEHVLDPELTNVHEAALKRGWKAEYVEYKPRKRQKVGPGPDNFVGQQQGGLLALKDVSPDTAAPEPSTNTIRNGQNAAKFKIVFDTKESTWKIVRLQDFTSLWYPLHGVKPELQTIEGEEYLVDDEHKTRCTDLFDRAALGLHQVIIIDCRIHMFCLVPESC